jgi:hypothetical protein
MLRLRVRVNGYFDCCNLIKTLCSQCVTTLCATCKNGAAKFPIPQLKPVLHAPNVFAVLSPTAPQPQMSSISNEEGLVHRTTAGYLILGTPCNLVKKLNICLPRQCGGSPRHFVDPKPKEALIGIFPCEIRSYSLKFLTLR